MASPLSRFFRRCDRGLVAQSRPVRGGFTLIELLVVIAIIALLVGILLPAIGKARKASWKAISLSNIRQITAAMYTYRDQYKQYLPVTLTYSPRGSAPSTPGQRAAGWATWQYGGKNNDQYWVSAYGGVFDIEAADRPLNPFITENLLEAPPAPARLGPIDPVRKTLQLPVFRDPADKVSYQRSATFSTNPTESPISCYDDVGTSYQYQAKWFDRIYPGGISDFDRAFQFGTERLRLGDQFQPSRLVWLNDQFADVVVNNTSTRFQLRNGYGDINRSVMAFMDGHASYTKVRPGANAEAFTNGDYTMVFEDLRIPR